MKKNQIYIIVLAIFIGITTNSCKKETPNNNNNNTTTTAPEQYILMNGLKVTIKNPKNGSISLTGGDSTLTWAGNEPSTLLGDSVVKFIHPVGVKRGTNIISDFATEFGEVEIIITYGETDSKTYVYIKEGEYKLEKVNGIWYSVLKNGKGEGKKGSADVTYTGIECRLAWPSTFK